MAQLALLTLVCKDTPTGLVVAGDTAQTITKGVAFRFADVGAMLYEQHYGLSWVDDDDTHNDPDDSSPHWQAAAAAGPVASKSSSSSSSISLQRQGSATSSCSSALSTARSSHDPQPQQMPRSSSAPADAAGGATTAAAAADVVAAACSEVQREAKIPKRMAKSLAFAKSKHIENFTKAATLIKLAEDWVQTAASSSNSSASRSDSRKLPSKGSQGKARAAKQAELAADESQLAAQQTSNLAAGGATSSSNSSSSPRAAAANRPAVAAQLTLRQNWRTQAHVLAVANAITDVLYHLFPGTVDKLPAETSSVKGDVPVLLQPGDHNDPLLSVFGSSNGVSIGDDTSSSISDPDRKSRLDGAASMNAQTAVLVRDDAAAAAVRRLVGDGALVLTVAEAKGLEFEVREREQHNFLVEQS